EPQSGDAIDAYSLHVGGAFCKRGPAACISVSCFQSADGASLQARKLSQQGVLRSSREEQIAAVTSDSQRRQRERPFPRDRYSQSERTFSSRSGNGRTA